MKTNLHSIMSHKIFTVSMETPIDQVKKLMEEKRIRHLPVIDKEHQLVGVVSASDLQRLQSENIPVSILMSSPVEFVDDKTSVRSAILRMLEKKISCLLVANQNQEAVGILTTDDLLWNLAERLIEDPQLGRFLNQQLVGEIANELALAGI